MRQLASRGKQLPGGQDVGPDQPAEAEPERRGHGEQPRLVLGDDEAGDGCGLGQRTDQQRRQPAESVGQPSIPTAAGQRRRTRAARSAWPRPSPASCRDRRTARSRARTASPSVCSIGSRRPPAARSRIGRQLDHSCLRSRRLCSDGGLGRLRRRSQEQRGQRHDHGLHHEPESDHGLAPGRYRGGARTTW